MANTCDDRNCTQHGNLIPRGRTFRGTVVSSKAQKTAVVEWTRRVFIPKFERYEVRRSKVTVHNPSCLNVKKGDVVQIQECRKLSKTKSFVITQKMGEDIVFLERESEKEMEEIKKKEQTKKPAGKEEQ